MSKQIEDSTNQLEGKLDEIKTENDEEKGRTNQNFINVRDELGRKIKESADNLSSKCDEKLEQNTQGLSDLIDGKIENLLTGIKTDMDEMEKNVADALENEKLNREKLGDDTKMALEEEKMLRAQDIGIIRLL